MPTITDIGRSAHGARMASIMGDSFEVGYRDLSDTFRRELNHYGITEWEWEFTRNLPELLDMEDGLPKLWMDRLKQRLGEEEAGGMLVRGGAEEIYRKFEMFTGEVVKVKGTPIAGDYELSLIAPSRDADSIWFNVHSLMTQYMGVAIAAFRSVFDGISPRLPGKGYMNNDRLYMKNVAEMMAFAASVGMLQVFLKDMMKLRDPTRDMTQMRYWMDVYKGSGVLGLWGDFLLGESGGPKHMVFGSFLGPVISGPGYEGLELLKAGLGLDVADGGKAAKRLAGELVPTFGPLQTLFLNSVMLETMFGPLGGSSQSRAMVRNRLEEIGSGYLFD